MEADSASNAVDEFVIWCGLRDDVTQVDPEEPRLERASQFGALKGVNT